MEWTELEQAQPGLAAAARTRLAGRGVVIVATIRRDGTPRVSPVEPLLLDGTLWLSMMWHSAKARDLLRDPRILVHSVISGRDGGEGEVKLRGLARAVDDREVQARYSSAVAAALGWQPEPGRFHLFGVDIAHCALVEYDEQSGDQHAAMWPPPAEFVRRGTSATSVGPREPVAGSRFAPLLA